MRDLIELIEQTLQYNADDDDDSDYVDHDEEHAKAQQETGFWGRAGAGLIFMAQDTGRFLIAHRSAHVDAANTWGSWGGAVDPNEDLKKACIREAYEETKYSGKLDLHQLYVFKQDTFRYTTFLGIIDTEFTPILNWENQGYVWCEYGEWPTPLHMGLEAIIEDQSSLAMMKAYSSNHLKEYIEYKKKIMTECKHRSANNY